MPNVYVLSDPSRLMFWYVSLAIDVTLPESTGAVTWHRRGSGMTYILSAGNHVGAPVLPTESTALNYFLKSVEVKASEDTGVVVRFVIYHRWDGVHL